jgi:hypothetical protein
VNQSCKTAREFKVGDGNTDEDQRFPGTSQLAFRHIGKHIFAIHSAEPLLSEVDRLSDLSVIGSIGAFHCRQNLNVGTAQSSGELINSWGNDLVR